MEEEQISPLENLYSKTVNLEMAFYRNKPGEITNKLHTEYLEAIKFAQEQGCSKFDINRVELVGKLNAALEEGDTEKVNTYEQLLEDLLENNP